MSNSIENKSLLEFSVYEIIEQLAQLENIVLHNEKDNSIQNLINEVFRLVHSLMNSSAAMSLWKVLL